LFLLVETGAMLQSCKEAACIWSFSNAASSARTSRCKLTKMRIEIEERRQRAEFK
jgi:hypothetical protein